MVNVGCVCTCYDDGMDGQTIYEGTKTTPEDGMEVVEKPPKMRLRTTAELYFAQHPGAMAVGLRTKEGREFWYRRDPRTGEPIKTDREQAIV